MIYNENFLTLEPSKNRDPEAQTVAGDPTVNGIEITRFCILSNCFWIKNVYGSSEYNILDLPSAKNNFETTNGKFKIL